MLKGIRVGRKPFPDACKLVLNVRHDGYLNTGYC